MLRRFLKGSSLLSVAFAVGALSFTTPGTIEARQGVCDSHGNQVCHCDFDYDQCIVVGGQIWCPYGCEFMLVIYT